MKTIQTVSGNHVPMETLDRVLKTRMSQGVTSGFVIDCPQNGDIATDVPTQAYSVEEAWRIRAAEAIGYTTVENMQKYGYTIRISENV